MNRPRARLGIGRRTDGGDAGDHVRSCFASQRCALSIQTTDGHDRKRRGLDRLAQELEPHDVVGAPLAGGRKHRPEAEQVGAGLARRAHLIQRVGRDADAQTACEIVLAEQRDGQIFLAHMHTLSAREQSDVEPVVDHEGHAMSFTRGGERARERELYAIGAVFHAQLQHGGAAHEDRLRHLEWVAPGAGVRIDDGIEAARS